MKQAGARGHGGAATGAPLSVACRGESETARLTRRTKPSHSPFAQRTKLPQPVRAANNSSFSTAPQPVRAAKNPSFSTAPQPVRAAKNPSFSAALQPVRAANNSSLSAAPQPVSAANNSSLSTAPQPIRAANKPLKLQRYPMVIRLALPPAAAVFTLSERSISRRSSSRLVSPRAKPCTETIAPSRAAICSHRVRS